LCTGVAGVAHNACCRCLAEQLPHHYLVVLLLQHTAATLLQLSELLSEVSLSKQPGLQAAAEALVAQLHKALAGIPARVLAGDAEQGLAALISSWGLEPQV
jgi:hypothetical protein